MQLRLSARRLPSRSTLALATEDATYGESLTHALSRRGFEVLVLRAAEQLWSVPVGGMPCGAIIDVPDAVLLARQLVEILPSMPILLLSGYESRARSLAAVCLGNVTVRKKPLDADQALIALRLRS